MSKTALFWIFLTILLASINAHLKYGKCPKIKQPICTVTCTDRSCSYDQKCCPTQCGGFLCVDPIRERHEIAARGPKRKSGKCPRPIHFPVCRITCSNDFACDGIKKCCFTKCGGSVCVQPIRKHRMEPTGYSNSNAENTVSQEKPGKCPNRLGFPICSRTCDNDMVCSGAHKCCKTECGGSVCIEAAKQPEPLHNEIFSRLVSAVPHIVARIHEGIPIIFGENLSRVAKNGSCPSALNYPVCGLTCSDDQACGTTNKCCPTECGGSLCIEPITQRPTTETPVDSKAGDCPHRLNFPVCEMTCSDDSHCDGSTKCCQTNCGGSICISPLHLTTTSSPETAGVCPVKPTSPWICTSSCSNDNQCRKPLKCCKNRCDALVCMKT